MLEKIVIVIGVSLDIVNSSIHKREREWEGGERGEGEREREREGRNLHENAFSILHNVYMPCIFMFKNIRTSIWRICDVEIYTYVAYSSHQIDSVCDNLITDIYAFVWNLRMQKKI